MKMTYRRLKEQLEKFTDEQLDHDVSIMTHDHEFYEMWGHIHFTTEEVGIYDDENEDPSVGILDEGHPWLSLDLGLV